MEPKTVGNNVHRMSKVEVFVPSLILQEPIAAHCLLNSATFHCTWPVLSRRPCRPGPNGVQCRHHVVATPARMKIEALFSTQGWTQTNANSSLSCSSRRPLRSTPVERRRFHSTPLGRYGQVGRFVAEIPPRLPLDVLAHLFYNTRESEYIHDRKHSRPAARPSEPLFRLCFSRTNPRRPNDIVPVGSLRLSLISW